MGQSEVCFTQPSRVQPFMPWPQDALAQTVLNFPDDKSLIGTPSPGHLTNHTTGRHIRSSGTISCVVRHILRVNVPHEVFAVSTAASPCLHGRQAPLLPSQDSGPQQ